MINFREQLNKSQFEAVSKTDGALLVIAGAGSGKTRVIEYRVMYLVDKGIAPQSILLLTFTRKAAQQMLSRAANRDPRCGFVDGGTFHSFAYKILKRHCGRLGWNNFTILDEADADNAVALCAGRLGMDNKDKRFPKKDTIRKIISMAINKSKTIDEIMACDYPDHSDFIHDVKRIAAEYGRFKMEKAYCDYDDLLIHLENLLSRYEDIRLELSSKYRYIMVDEYQDTNKMQADIAYYLAKDHGNIMAVGDDAQSIYGFRGASHENIMEFTKRFSGAFMIKLEANYRSSQSILDVANAVLRNMRTKFAKDLFSAGRRPGDKPVMMYFQDNSMEAEWIARKILESMDDGLELGKQAVLFRSAYISIPLQMELSRRGIPFQVYGGMKFYETAHVKDVLAHLKVLLNPSDEIAWARALTLIEGIGPKTASRITASIIARGKLAEISDEVLRGEFSKNKFASSLETLSRAVLSADHEGEDIAKKLSVLIEYYTPLMKLKFDDWQQRLSDLDALKSVARKYGSLQDFLAEFTIEPPDSASEAGAGHSALDNRPLTLSTIHSAKGLEWECVYLMGLVDGILPVSFALEDDDRIEEEHRLFYVALTRAKQKLYLSAHQEGSNFGTISFNKISRFLDSREVLAALHRDVEIDYDI